MRRPSGAGMSLWRSGRTIFRPVAQRDPPLGRLLPPRRGDACVAPTTPRLYRDPGTGGSPFRPFGVVRPFDTFEASHAQGPGVGSTDSRAAPDERRPVGRPSGARMSLWRSGRTIFRPVAQRHPPLGRLLPLRRGDACVAPTTPRSSRDPGTGVFPLPALRRGPPFRHVRGIARAGTGGGKCRFLRGS